MALVRIRRRAIGLARDSFDRADGAIGAMDSGQTWGTDGSDWQVAGGLAIPNETLATSYTRVDVGTFEHRSRITLKARTGANAAGLAARQSPAWGAYMLWVGQYPNGSVEVWELVGGNWGAAAIASASSPAFDASADRVMECHVYGSVLDLYVDGALAFGGVRLLTPNPDATMIGFFSDSIAASGAIPALDDFRCWRQVKRVIRSRTYRNRKA